MVLVKVTLRLPPLASVKDAPPLMVSAPALVRAISVEAVTVAGATLRMPPFKVMPPLPKGVPEVRVAVSVPALSVVTPV